MLQTFGRPVSIQSFITALLVFKCSIGSVRCEERVINVVVPISAPFACTEDAPCSPVRQILSSSDGCIYGGVRAANLHDELGLGKCVHGFIIDLLDVAASEGGFRYDLWCWTNTNATLGGGYNNMVKNVFYEGEIPGSDKSHGDESYRRVPNMCGNTTCDMAIGDISLTWARRRINASQWSSDQIPLISL